jgi:hypothetical protein
MMHTYTLEQHWKSYVDAFNTPVEEERVRLLEQSVCDDVVFTNPGGEGKSRAGLIAHIGNFQKTRPGLYFSTDKLYAQPDKLLAVWSMHKQDGTKVAAGYNFVLPDEQGRFNYMAGFF